MPAWIMRLGDDNAVTANSEDRAIRPSSSVFDRLDIRHGHEFRTVLIGLQAEDVLCESIGLFGGDERLDGMTRRAPGLREAMSS